MGEYLTLDTTGPIPILFLDSPPKNLMVFGFFDELSDLLEGPLSRMSPEGLIIRGRGRHFSAGADVERLVSATQEPGDDAHTQLIRQKKSLSRLESLPYPVVAAVDGACLGSALELALACRGIVATRGALFGLPEASFGLIPGCGGTIRLPERVGLSKGLKMILTGRMLHADEALDIGLVDAISARPSLERTAIDYARGLAGGIIT